MLSRNVIAGSIAVAAAVAAVVFVRSGAVARMWEQGQATARAELAADSFREGAERQLQIAKSVKASCHDAVLARLRTPATARFRPVPRGKDWGPADARAWVVRGTVDAQNACGALIRSSYARALTNVGAGRFTVDRARVTSP